MSGRDKRRIFSSRVWTRPEAHKGSYAMEMERVFPGVKAAGI